MGTAPSNFPPNPFMQPGQVQAGNKLGNTGAFGSEVIFTAPVSGWYQIGWGCHIQQTDAAGSLTLVVLPPHSVAVPGVQAAPATPSDGKGPGVPCYFNAGDTVTISCTVSGLTGTTFDVWVFATRLS